MLAASMALLALAIGPATALAEQAKPKEGARKSAPTPAGDWNGTADVNGEAVSFSLSLKIDGPKASGTIVVPEGPADIAGEWVKDELRLSFQHPTAGPVSLNGALKDDKLSGFYQAGDTSGAWSAARKP
jgi:hypothetical protein